MAKVLSRRKLAWTSERREAQRQRRLGKHWPASVRRKISEANKGQIPWSKGTVRGPLAPEIRKKISQATEGRWKGMTYEEIYGPKKAAELRKMRSVSMKGKKKSKAHRARLVEVRSKRVIPFIDTRPEKSVALFLMSHNIKFEKHGLIPDCFHQFDFVLRRRKTVIEVDGCWWHGCKSCHVKISKASREQRARDRWWEKKAKKVGWRVVRIWEHDTRANNFAVLCEALGIVKPQKEVPRGKGASIR